ncbi:MAG: zinc-binding alcohol dehydrogenase family protein [Deltaproteobacteria bacterium]|nr:MAG: zinc-binding alcohol dehydrogenase family protein [Deltaproteobacteria bacterium]
MKAFVVSEQNTDQFVEVEQERPTPTGHDLLVEVKAVSLNPVDTKVRPQRANKALGFDASGVVVAVGEEVKHYRPGDEVYYAGDITRAGSNASFQLVDERIVGRKPISLHHIEAAALPLTSLTAWEGLYEKLKVKEGGTLLVINGAGGVGSLAIQLAKRVSNMTVIATASRAASQEWVKSMGADAAINHREDMAAQLKALGHDHVDAIFNCYNTDVHFDAMAEIIAPGGQIVSIVSSPTPLDMTKLFSKGVSFSWEFMFTKSMYQTTDMSTQRDILNSVADLVEQGVLVTTLTENAGTLTPETLAQAHQRQESGSMIGKLGLSMPQS